MPDWIGLRLRNKSRRSGNALKVHQDGQTLRRKQDLKTRTGRTRSFIQTAQGFVSARVHRILVKKVGRILNALNPALPRQIPRDCVGKSRGEIDLALPAPLLL